MNQNDVEPPKTTIFLCACEVDEALDMLAGLIAEAASLLVKFMVNNSIHKRTEMMSEVDARFTFLTAFASQLHFDDVARDFSTLQSFSTQRMVR